MEGICSSGKTLGLHFRKILCEPWKDKEGKQQLCVCVCFVCVCVCVCVCV